MKRNEKKEKQIMLYAKTKAMRKYEEAFTYLSSWNAPNIWGCHKILIISNQEPPEPFAKNEYIVQDEQFLEEYLKEEFYREVLKQQIMYLDTLAENKQNFNAKKAVIYSEVDYILKQNGKTLTCKDLGLF